MIQLSETDAADVFKELIEEYIEMKFEQNEQEGYYDRTMPDQNIRTFEEAGLLTMDQGLVVKIGSQEFQITIKERTW